MRKILYLNEFGTLNGGENSCLALLNQLKTQHQVVMMCPSPSDFQSSLSELGIRVVPLELFEDEANSKRKPIEQIDDYLVELIEREEPDLVHANSLAMSRYLGRISNRLECQTVGHIRDILRLSKAVVHNLNSLGKVICVSSATRKFHLSQGLGENHSTVIYNGIDCPSEPAPSDGDIRGELGIPVSAPIFLGIGQIGMRKGWDVLLESFASHSQTLIEQSIAPSKLPHLMIVGQRHSTKAEAIEYEKQLHEAVILSQLDQRVHFLGRRNDVGELMLQSDCLVHPAKQEPLGRVLLEAVSNNLPVIAFEVGGTREIFGDEYPLIPVSIDQLTLEIHCFCNCFYNSSLENYADRARMAKVRLQELFSVHRASEQLNNIYSELLA